MVYIACRDCCLGIWTHNNTHQHSNGVFRMETNGGLKYLSFVILALGGFFFPLETKNDTLKIVGTKSGLYSSLLDYWITDNLV